MVHFCRKRGIIIIIIMGRKQKDAKIIQKPDGMWQCTNCGVDTFASHQNGMRHYESDHEDRRSCLFCKKTYSCRQTRRIHMKAKHFQLWVQQRRPTRKAQVSPLKSGGPAKKVSPKRKAKTAAKPRRCPARASIATKTSYRPKRNANRNAKYREISDSEAEDTPEHTISHSEGAGETKRRTSTRVRKNLVTVNVEDSHSKSQHDEQDEDPDVILSGFELKCESDSISEAAPQEDWPSDNGARKNSSKLSALAAKYSGSEGSSNVPPASNSQPQQLQEPKSPPAEEPHAHVIKTEVKVPFTPVLMELNIDESSYDWKSIFNSVMEYTTPFLNAPAPPAGGPPPPPPAFELDMDNLQVSDDRASPVAALKRGDYVTKGLRTVSSEMQTHKNPNLRAGKVFASGAQAVCTSASKKPAAPVAKPPKLALEGNKWVVEHQIGQKELKIENVDNNQVVYAYACKDSVIHVKGKINSVRLDSCVKTTLIFDSLVESVEFFNCRNCQMQVTGSVPTVVIYRVNGLQMFLSNESLGAEILSTKSSALNVMVPQDSGAFVKRTIPDCFRTTVAPEGLAITGC